MSIILFKIIKGKKKAISCVLKYLLVIYLIVNIDIERIDQTWPHAALCPVSCGSYLHVESHADGHCRKKLCRENSICTDENMYTVGELFFFFKGFVSSHVPMFIIWLSAVTQ